MEQTFRPQVTRIRFLDAVLPPVYSHTETMTTIMKKETFE